LFVEKEKTNSGYKHNKKVLHGILNLTFRMLQHTPSEERIYVVARAYDKSSLIYHAKPSCYVCNHCLFSPSLEIEMAEKQEFLWFVCFFTFQSDQLSEWS